MSKYYVYYALYKGFSSVSRAIQAKTHSEYSHCSIVYPDLETVIEAWKEGITKNHWHGYHQPTTVIEFYKIECSEAQQRGFYEWADLQEGKGYDHKGVINIGLTADIGHGEDNWFCSELLKADFDEQLISTLDVVPHLCSPRDISMIPKSIKEFMFKRVVPGTLPEPESERDSGNVWEQFD